MNVNTGGSYKIEDDGKVVLVERTQETAPEPVKQIVSAPKPDYTTGKKRISKSSED